MTGHAKPVRGEETDWRWHWLLNLSPALRWIGHIEGMWPSFGGRRPHATPGREENCSAGGGGAEAHFPNPPPSLAAMTGGRGSGRGCPTCRAAGGGGGQPNIYGSK